MMLHPCWSQREPPLPPGPFVFSRKLQIGCGDQDGPALPLAPSSLSGLLLGRKVGHSTGLPGTPSSHPGQRPAQLCCGRHKTPRLWVLVPGTQREAAGAPSCQGALRVIPGAPCHYHCPPLWVLRAQMPARVAQLVIGSSAAAPRSALLVSVVTEAKNAPHLVPDLGARLDVDSFVFS